MQCFLYILRSETSGKLYIGQTNNLTHRLLLHNSNQVTSTRNKGPWTIIYSKECLDRSEAMKYESKFKKWKNRQRILDWIKRQTSQSG